MGNDKIQRLTDLFDEKAEIAAWLILLSAHTLLVSARLEQWPFVAMVGLALLTFLGTGYYGAKFKVGPQGLEVSK